MADLKKFDITGKEVGRIALDDDLLNAEVNGQMVKDYIVALRHNARQWSACAKDKSEVKCSGIKPHPQKGTGRARQGSLASPQYRGGGVVFGPKPKFDQHVRINKKERRAIISYLLAEKVKDGSLAVLSLPQLEQPKTKLISDFLKQQNITGKRVLFLGAGDKEHSENFARSVRNIPKVNMKLASTLNGYDAMLHSTIYITDGAVDELVEILKRGVE